VALAENPSVGLLADWTCKSDTADGSGAMHIFMQSVPWLLLSGALGGLLCCQRFENGEGYPATSVASAASSVQSPIFTLGQTASLPTYRAKLVSQRDCSGASAAQTRHATRAWAVELEITNIGANLLPASPFYATLLDDEKHAYTTSLAGCGPLLPAKLLGPNETVRGYVPYELPVATPSVTLSYRPVNRGAASHTARFRVEL
jgi:hypothetical protein